METKNTYCGGRERIDHVNFMSTVRLDDEEYYLPTYFVEQIEKRYLNNLNCMSFLVEPLKGIKENG